MPLPTLISSTKWDRIRESMISDFLGIDGTATASSTVDENSASGQAVLKLTATTNFVIGESVIINPGGAKEEVKSVLSIQSGVSVTLLTNLKNTHLAADGATVKQDWYNFTFGANSLELVDDETKLGPPVDGPWPKIRMFIGPETPVESLTGYDTLARNMHFVGWFAVKMHHPTDQQLEGYYQMLLADFKKAVHDNWTRNDEADSSRLVGPRRVTPDQLPPPEGEFRQGIPMVGVFATVEIDYEEKRGDAYA